MRIVFFVRKRNRLGYICFAIVEFSLRRIIFRTLYIAIGIIGIFFHKILQSRIENGIIMTNLRKQIYICIGSILGIGQSLGNINGVKSRISIISFFYFQVFAKRSTDGISSSIFTDITLNNGNASSFFIYNGTAYILFIIRQSQFVISSARHIFLYIYFRSNGFRFLCAAFTQNIYSTTLWRRCFCHSKKLLGFCIK